jgi:hypothetical protein
MRYLIPLLIVCLLHGLEEVVVSVGPADDVQAVIDNTVPGGRVVLDDGTYHTRLRIDRRIRLEAAHPGAVVLSGALSERLRFDADPSRPGSWVTHVPHEVAWVRWGRINLMHYADLEALAEFQMRPGHRLKQPRPGIPAGFCWDSGELRLHWPEGGDPNTAEVAVAASDDQPLVRIQADNVEVSGLRLDCSPRLGVEVTDAYGCSITDCVFTGMKASVSARGPRSGSLRLAHCAFDGGDSWAWSRDLFNAQGGGFWGFSAGMYDSNLEINHVFCEGPGNIFADNVVIGGFDGFQMQDSHEAERGTPGDVPTEVTRNLMLEVFDNAVELDSTMKWLHARVHHNLFVDGLEPISAAPVQHAQLLIDHNAFVSREPCLYWSSFVKLLHFDGSRRDVPISGITIAHNSVIGRTAKLVATVPDGDGGTYRDVLLVNNLLVGPRKPRPLPPGIVLLPAGDPALPPGAVREGPMPVVAEQLELPLPPGSPALATGWSIDGSRPDLGAVAACEVFRLHEPGPRWSHPTFGPPMYHLPACLGAVIEPSTSESK